MQLNFVIFSSSNSVKADSLKVILILDLNVNAGGGGEVWDLWGAAPLEKRGPGKTI